LKNKDGKFAELKLLPGGNWLRKSRNFNLKKGILTAELKDTNGQWKKHTIKVKPGVSVIEKNG